MEEERISKFYPDKNNFKFRAYHSTMPSLMPNIFEDGCLDPLKGHSKQCKHPDIIWFSIDDVTFGGGDLFTLDIDQDVFKEFDFKWVNDYYLVTPCKVFLMDKRFRIYKIDNVKIDKLFERMYDGTAESLQDFVDMVSILSFRNELPKDILTKKLSQQYDFDCTTWVKNDTLYNNVNNKK